MPPELGNKLAVKLLFARTRDFLAILGSEDTTRADWHALGTKLFLDVVFEYSTTQQARLSCFVALLNFYA